MNQRVRAYVGVGSNIEPRRHIPHALHLLEQRFGALSLSPVYACAAVGIDGPDFLNLVVGLDTAADVPALAQALRCIEEHCGRVRPSANKSRTMDLDLLLYGDLVSPEWRLPRDDILRYAFTLKPLADLAPDARHPIDNRRYADLWGALQADFARRGQPLRVSSFNPAPRAAGATTD